MGNGRYTPSSGEIHTFPAISSSLVSGRVRRYSRSSASSECLAHGKAILNIPDALIWPSRLRRYISISTLPGMCGLKQRAGIKSLSLSLSYHEKIGVNVVLLGREDLRALQISRKRRSEVCILEWPQVRGHGRIRGADFCRGDSEVCPAQAAARNEFLIYRQIRDDTPSQAHFLTYIPGNYCLGAVGCGAREVVASWTGRDRVVAVEVDKYASRVGMRPQHYLSTSGRRDTKRRSGKT